MLWANEEKNEQFRKQIWLSEINEWFKVRFVSLFFLPITASAITYFTQFMSAENATRGKPIFSRCVRTEV
jgi:hypothetical protein